MTVIQRTQNKTTCHWEMARMTYMFHFCVQADEISRWKMNDHLSAFERRWTFSDKKELKFFKNRGLQFLTELSHQRDLLPENVRPYFSKASLFFSDNNLNRHPRPISEVINF